MICSLCNAVLEKMTNLRREVRTRRRKWWKDDEVKRKTSDHTNDLLLCLKQWNAHSTDEVRWWGERNTVQMYANVFLSLPPHTFRWPRHVHISRLHQREAEGPSSRRGTNPFLEFCSWNLEPLDYLTPPLPALALHFELVSLGPVRLLCLSGIELFLLFHHRVDCNIFFLEKIC